MWSKVSSSLPAKFANIHKPNQRLKIKYSQRNVPIYHLQWVADTAVLRCYDLTVIIQQPTSTHYFSYVPVIPKLHKSKFVTSSML